MFLFRALIISMLVVGLIANCNNCANCDVNTNTCLSCNDGFSLNNGSCNNTLSPGAIVGIIIGGVFGAIFLLFVIVCIVDRCQRSPPLDDPYLENPMNTLYATGSVQVIPAPVVLGYTNLGMTSSQQLVVNPVPIPTNYPTLQELQPMNPTATYLNRDTCTICLSSGTNAKLMPCTHQFHINCLVQWANKKRVCPNCNSADFQVYILCSRCYRFNEQVTFCPVGCQKPNHMNCFMERNQNKLVCRSCVMNHQVMTRSRIAPPVFRAIM